MPNPVAHCVVNDPDRVEEIRRLLCYRYTDCLDAACASNWEGFSCNQCNAYAPVIGEQKQQDQEGLINLAAEIAAAKHTEDDRGAAFHHQVYEPQARPVAVESAPDPETESDTEAELTDDF